MDNDELMERFAYHPPTSEEIVRGHERVRELVGETAEELNAILHDSREKSLCMTALDEACMWANAAIARLQRLGPDSSS